MKTKFVAEFFAVISGLGKLCVTRFKPLPTPKTILGQVHANSMKFSEYVGAVVERLW
jgi:hypothetical protein